MKKTLDGNTATAMIAYKINELAFIYPITPSSPMAELCDEWASTNKLNIYNQPLQIVEMQSEGGVAGALHGALLGGALSTTFTSSQGLLLMIPEMYKIAGERLPCVINVASRSLSTHALNIFGDHSDIMATLGSGFAMLCASNVQECQDFALISEIASLRTNIPFLHFFDGFRTSHEIQKITLIDDATINQLMDKKLIEAFKQRALNPNQPKAHGTAQNPDVFFQNRIRSVQGYENLANVMQQVMKDFKALTNREYNLFDYYGSKKSKYIVIAMGSACSVLKEAVDYLGEDYGVITVRLFQPFDTETFLKTLPKTSKFICVLERYLSPTTKGELTKQCAMTLRDKDVISGIYGLGGKEFDLNMAISVFENLANKKQDNFTIGIDDDISHNSLTYKNNLIKDNDIYEYKFFGLGSDGTVSANKNSIKIIGDNTPLEVQGYFEYDSKKSGSLTISHLRIGIKQLSSRLVNNADLIACHNFNFLYKYDILANIKPNGILLLNSPYDVDTINEHLPKEIVEKILALNLKLYIINANQLAKDCGLNNKINIIMQSAFFKLTNFMDYELAKSKLKEEIKQTYSTKGEKIIQSNYIAIEQGEKFTLVDNSKLIINKAKTINNTCTKSIYTDFIEPINTLKGNNLPVSAFNQDGSIQTGTSKYEKRGITTQIPHWIKENCIQCNMCALSCPHATIRPILIEKDKLKNAPDDFEFLQDIKNPNIAYSVIVNPKDCTGCGVCANVCPAKQKALQMQPIDELDSHIYDYSQTLGENEDIYPKTTIKGSQFKQPLFEFSGACAGCGETPYIKLLTQLFGEKIIFANATGCSSIYGGSCPTCPYTTNAQGQGPAWANSLFEDNAEFGFGIKIATDLNGHQHSIWLVGGDGWAYDIGYGGLDHVLASGIDINILVLDSEVYSNTGGQSSKSTPLGASAKFARLGKHTNKKPLAEMAMQYDNVYVAQISLGANMSQAITALNEAKAHKGPSLVIAYSPCINHGIDMTCSSESMKKAVQSGYFPIFRYDGKMHIDCKPDFDTFVQFLETQNRYRELIKGTEKTKNLLNQAKEYAIKRYNKLLLY